MKRPIRELMDEFLLKVYAGTAHEHRKQVLEEFVARVEGYDAFIAECDKKIDDAFELAGLQRVK